MTTDSKINKVVSCKIFHALFDAIKNKNVNLDKIISNIPYNLSYLYNKGERVEWSIYCKIISNMRDFLEPSEFENIGKQEAMSISYPAGLIAGFLFFSSNKFAKILVNQFFKVGDNMFNCIRHETKFFAKNNVQIILQLYENYEFCPEFFLTTKGYFTALGELAGNKSFIVNIKWLKDGAIYEISWKQKRALLNFKKWLKWLFNIKKALLELTDSNEELLNQYNRLEDSKKVLQKQTTQLKTAYDITKSIRQSREIVSTLNNITTALVNNAEISFAQIRLLKDAEAKAFCIETFSGKEEAYLNSIIKPININNEKIGELILQPKLSSDPAEFDELVDYLMPVINITIHDSLVLRTVTDYKNNLETKVEERTSELKKAQDELSKTIQLLQETQQAQNRFYTNISHEFRTPLTLILGPANQIMEQTRNEQIKVEADTIRRSAKKLNKLANQLLDISRIEAGRMRLKTVRQNLIPVIKNIINSFHELAQSKSISLNYNFENEIVMIYLENGKIDKIMSNLLSNAIKFTPVGGTVNVEIKYLPFPDPAIGELKNSFVEISVSDTGIGIPAEQMNKIFDRFYQVDNSLNRNFEGAGIGLSLTKELVELHKGKIAVESTESKGSTFRISLPLGKESFLPEEIVDDLSSANANKYDFKQQKIYSDEPAPMENLSVNKTEENLLQEDTRQLLLIIEDNTDMRNYIAGIVNSQYKIAGATNGEEGLSKSFELIPDIIISDIMMPRLDGLQLCNKLKSDTRTSHIPIILLTAKATMKDKLEGLRKGADDYIMKPFEAEELKIRINNLLGQRKRIHEHFRKHGLFEIEEKQISSLDKKFLKNAVEIIDEHISDNCFNVENFADDLAMSRSQLHRKLIALTGESPGELIKRFRLNKAAVLLEQKYGNVTEVAFDVGFNDLSYFAACFKKQFGISPSHYHHKKSG